MSRGVPDRVRYARTLRRAGKHGAHTHDIRREGISGNPSQRAAELRDRGFGIRIVRDHRHGRNGARHILLYDAGDARAFLTESELLVANEEKARQREHPEGEGSPQLFEQPHEPRNAAVADWDEAA